MFSDTESVTIREAASLTGLTTHTLRYYERLGLAIADRSASGHRRYRNSDIEWIKILTCLRETGMPIQKMIEFTALQTPKFEGALLATPSEVWIRCRPKGKNSRRVPPSPNASSTPADYSSRRQG